MVSVKVKSGLFILTIIMFCSPISVDAELFTAEPLVQLPGINSEAALTTADGGPTYLAWVNYLDGLYSVYAQQIFPVVDSVMLVDFSADSMYSPSIEIDPWHGGVKLVWSRQRGDTTRLIHSNYVEGIWSSHTILHETTMGNILGDAGVYRVAWSVGGSLFMRQLFVSSTDSTWADPILVDMGGCSNPDISLWDHTQTTSVLYEVSTADSTIIRLARWSEYQSVWEYTTLSNSPQNSHPRFGPEFGLTFQTYVDSIWKISYSLWGDWEWLVQTPNTAVNYTHPLQYNFGIPVLSTRENLTEYLVIFESDSLENNPEIMAIMYPPYGQTSQIINISNLPGDDRYPNLTTMRESDSTIVAVLWEHETASGSELWWSRANHELIYGGIEPESESPSSFQLLRTFPNPFNSEMMIKYSLTKGMHVSVDVYDISARHVARLLHGFQTPGEHQVNWHPETESSGIYFIMLTADHETKSIKSIQLK